MTDRYEMDIDCPYRVHDKKAMKYSNFILDSMTDTEDCCELLNKYEVENVTVRYQYYQLLHLLRLINKQTSIEQVKRIITREFGDIEQFYDGEELIKDWITEGYYREMMKSDYDDN